MSTRLHFEPCGCILSKEDGEIQAFCDGHDRLQEERMKLRRELIGLTPVAELLKGVKR